MRRLPAPLLLMIVLLGVPMAVCAQVYQWTDANGTVHYADSPPAHNTQYKSVDIASATLMSPPEMRAGHGQGDESSNEGDTSTPASGEVPPPPANRQELCDKLEANLNLLNQDRPVVRRNKDGKNQLLTKEQRVQAVAQAQKRYQGFCKD